jgi:hypothetical protein
VSSLTIEQARLSREVLVRELAAMTHGSWDPRFQGDVIPCIRFIVARAIALVSDKIDCEIGFDRFPVSGITVMNPERIEVTPRGGYPVLRQRLECDPLYDSVPLSIGRSARGSSLWDGHRRLETYRSAGRPDFPAWIASFRPGAGLLRVVD